MEEPPGEYTEIVDSLRLSQRLMSLGLRRRIPASLKNSLRRAGASPKGSFGPAEIFECRFSIARFSRLPLLDSAHGRDSKSGTAVLSDPSAVWRRSRRMWRDRLVGSELDQKTVGLVDADVVEERKTFVLFFRCQSKERADEMFVGGKERISVNFLFHQG